ncbi:hypothetical protein [Mesoplasma corruscae]|uniref:Uncharacterized protein n=1 Tax=Mesoplasma corruscae TaxID=216874 RepID=A0A2S5RHI2_9MOLU|nr:hypothetical protein [Mesoplasma corruscae]PPE06794.1 hypothetical protein MCORR_v1c04250 [Mesoplasma corruscae]
MTNEKFKMILEEVNIQFKDFYVICSFVEALKNEDFKNIMKI